MINRAIFNAVVLRHRWWTHIDNPEATLLKANGRRFTSHQVVRIARAYGVRRGLNLSKAGATGELAGRLSEIFSEFSGSLTDRSSLLEGIADEIKEFTHNRQISAVSKFAWFVHPDGWTMYDSRARRALRVSNHGDFYSKLDKLDFVGTCAKIEAVLDRHKMRAMAAGRIIDSYLLVLSANDRALDDELADAYLTSLLNPLQTDLRAAATEISECIAGDQFISEVC